MVCPWIYSRKHPPKMLIELSLKMVCPHSERNSPFRLFRSPSPMNGNRSGMCRISFPSPPFTVGKGPRVGGQKTDGVNSTGIINKAHPINDYPA